MIGILFQIILLLQGIAVLPNEGGTVTGILTSEAGRPAAGVRVAVMAQPENVADVAVAASLVSIAETDEAGRFLLENIPPGRYYITAGRVEQPTYYPGTMEITAGRIVQVSAGKTVSGVDFSIRDVSDRGVETINAALRIPVRIQMEGDVRIPVFSERGKVGFLLTHLPDGNRTEIPLDSPTLTLPIATGEYRVEIENLPDGYAVNSLSYGAINLVRDRLKMTLDDLPAPGAGEKMFFTTTQTGIVVQRRIQSGSTSLQGQGTFPQSAAQVVVMGSITAKSDVQLALSAGTPTPPASGVQVRGKTEYSGPQEIYISGVRGTLFADGTFEFRGVPAGRHIVIMLGSTSTSRQFAAVTAVGTSDVENVHLQEVIALPLDVMSPPASPVVSRSDPAATGLHSIIGHVLEDTNHRPVAGIVTLRSYGRSTTYSLPADGEFEIPNLLPGSYGLKVETFDRGTLTRTIVVEDNDLELTLSVPTQAAASLFR